MKLWIKIGLGVGGAIITAFGGKAWVDRHIYGEDGYNGLGYDRDGYNRDGFDQDGYGRDGYNQKGYNRSGFDRLGFDQEGYNCRGYDRDGFNRYGYDEKGFDIHGFNRSGYDRLGYNRDGFDKSGNTKSVYASIISQMEANQKKSYTQLNAHEFRYALSDIRVGIETGLKAILAHELGKGYEANNLDRNIGICESHRLFDQDFVEKLYGAKKHCNVLLHEDSTKTVDQVFFCYKVLCEVTDEVRAATGQFDYT